MNLQEGLNKVLKDSLEEVDLRIQAINENDKLMNEQIVEIVKKDKNNEDATDLIIKQRVNVSLSFLHREDLIKALSTLNAYYKLAKLTGVEIDLDEEEIKRLEYNVKNSANHFIPVKGKIVPVQEGLLEVVEKKLLESKAFNPEDFLKQVRKMPIYEKSTG